MPLHNSVTTEQDMLNDLLIFATGLDVVPMSGFEPKPSLGFRYPDDVRDDATAGYPIANTCANILRLPVLENYDDFAANMSRAIKAVSTFTLQ